MRRRTNPPDIPYCRRRHRGLDTVFFLVLLFVAVVLLLVSIVVNLRK